MTVNYYAQRVTVPTAFVTKGRQRVKQFQNSVYLRNGEEFELELFNPTQNKVLAKISLNGKSLGSGIIVRPGERVFLERYLDEAKKFRFETYEVEANNPNVDQAIRMNGFVEVEFFEEYKVQLNSITWTYNNGSDWYNQPTVTKPSMYYTGTTFKGVGNAHFTSGNTGQIPVSDGVNFSNSLNMDSQNISYCCNMADAEKITQKLKSAFKNEVKETGRVEKGSNSNQSFVYDDTSFNTWYTWRTTWKILPDSQRPRESHDLKSFCPNCGAKQKKHTHKFCPICGTKYE